MNKALLIGFTGDDPAVSILEGSNIRVANFSLATSKKWTDKSGQKQESTEWHRVGLLAQAGRGRLRICQKRAAALCGRGNQDPDV